MAVNQRSQAPSSEELSKAVGHLLRERKTYITPKEVREQLMRKHTTWNIPERRVAKFLKKEKRAVNYKGEKGGVSGFLGKILGSNKQQQRKSDDSTASLPEMHPASKSKSKVGNLVKAFSSKTEKLKGDDPVSPKENVFRGSNLDTGAEKTTLPYKNAEVERQGLAKALEEEAEHVQEDPSKVAAIETIKEEEKLPEDKNADYYVDDKDDDQNNLCHCDVCVIL